MKWLIIEHYPMKLPLDLSDTGRATGFSKSNFYRRSQSDWRWLTPNFQAEPVFALDIETPRTLRALLFKTMDRSVLLW
jgi:hypothetical protein